MDQPKYQVLARRYRPKRFSEVVGQEAVVTTLKNAIRFDRVSHAYLFCGSRGVGKTTLARLFAKTLNCSERSPDGESCNQCPSCLEIASGQSLDVIEIDGASNRGIDDIRQINETVGYVPSSGKFKIYIIDEVHMLTKEAFNALLKTLEEPPERAKFFFATTEPHKVLPTILSRCQRFDLNRISLSQITSKLEQISHELERSAENQALHLIASFSDGSLRDAESLFDQILCFTDGPITANAVRQTLGLLPTDAFFSLDLAFSEAKAAFAFELVEQLFQTGKDFSHFFEQLIEHYRLLSLCKTIGEKALPLPADLSERYLQSSRLYTAAQTLYLLEYLLQAETSFHKSLVPRVFLEATLLHVIRSKNRIPIEVLIRRLSELEQAVLSKQSVVTEALPPPPEPEPEAEPEPQETGLPPPTMAPNLPSEPVALKPIPFSPYAIAPDPAPSAPTPRLQEKQPDAASFAKPKPNPDSQKTAVSLEKTKEPQTPLINSPAPIAESKTPSSSQEKGTKEHIAGHYDTLMRFAAVELEGNLKTVNRES